MGLCIYRPLTDKFFTLFREAESIEAGESPGEDGGCSDQQSAQEFLAFKSSLSNLNIHKDCSMRVFNSGY